MFRRLSTRWTTPSSGSQIVGKPILGLVVVPTAFADHELGIIFSKLTSGIRRIAVEGQ